MKLRKFLSFVLIFTFIFISQVYAKDSQKDKSDFKDLPGDHWAYKAVMRMVEKGILKGYNDLSFKPKNQINRSEFATVLVKTLNLGLKNPEIASFIDVEKKSWAYSYVETAKYYLTGWKTDNGNLYKPKSPSVREDMAVAIVKALDIDETLADESILDDYLDKDQISPGLRKYIAAAIENGIMKGYEEDDGKKFKPQGPLTRAEAAVLLLNVLNENEEKITFDKTTQVDDTRPYVEDENNEKDYIPIVNGIVKDGKILLKWKKVNSNNFDYYKVVISKKNPKPRYPEDGYLTYITDVSKTSIDINFNQEYNGGDFEGYLKPGEKYYFSITACYKDFKKAGNSIALKIPKFNIEKPTSYDYEIPNLTGEVSDQAILLKWNQIDNKKLQGYKVVISKNNPSPKYPDDGYLFWITDKSKTSVVIDNSVEYKSGDFGKYLEAGQKYYFSITALYKDKKVPGNTIELVYPEELSEL
ncbi:MAG: S-layer homology domain-containing protein [Clostridiales bacterium]